jgi:hypothetical protein
LREEGGVIQRYAPDYDGEIGAAFCAMDDAGDYILHADHAEAMAAVRAKAEAAFALAKRFDQERGCHDILPLLREILSVSQDTPNARA